MSKNNKVNMKGGKSNERFNKTGKGVPTKSSRNKSDGFRSGKSNGAETGSYYDCGTNDISWYNKYPAMFGDATRIPFNVITGNNYPGVTSAIDNNGNPCTALNYNAPGILVLDYTPGIGITETNTDAPNRAFQALWSAIYSKTSGFLNFPAYTLATTYTAAQSIAQNIGFLKNALEISNTYIGDNVYWPRAFLHAMGIKPESVLGKQERARWELNNCIRDFNKLQMPKFIDLFLRHYRMARSIYSDGDKTISQFTLFRPNGYYLYNDLGVYDSTNQEYVTDENGTSIHRCDYYAMPYIVQGDSQFYQDVDIMDIIDIIKLQLRLIRTSSDFKFILGAIQRAFDSSQFISISEITADDTAKITKDDYVLAQIANATIVGNTSLSQVNQPNLSDSPLWHWDTWDIYGDTVNDIVKYTPCVSGKGCNATGNVILNTFADGVDDSWIMEATRMQAIVQPSVSTVNDGRSSYSLHRIDSCGADFITSIRLIKYDGRLDAITLAQFFGTVEANRDQVKSACALLKFRYAPRVFLTGNGDVLEFFSDLYYWTVLDRLALTRLHDTALLSMMEPVSELPIKHGY